MGVAVFDLSCSNPFDNLPYTMDDDAVEDDIFAGLGHMDAGIGRTLLCKPDVCFTCLTPEMC